MTADEIIAANPNYTFRKQTIGGMDGLIGTSESGVEVWFVYCGDYFLCKEGPWADAQIESARHQLTAVAGGRRIGEPVH